MSIDKFLDRTKRRDYNCLDFARDVWLELTGDDLKDLVHAPFNNMKVTMVGASKLQRLDRPESPCLVLMHRFPCVPHVGVFIDGNLLHLTDSGVTFFKFEHSQRYFKNIRFYK